MAVTTSLAAPRPDGSDSVDHFGVVDIVQSSYEGATFHSDVFREADGTLPVDVATIAHVSVTRVEPEILVPPRPGNEVRRATEDDRELRPLLRPDEDAAFPPAFRATASPVYGNLEFLDGSRGAHVNISGISGVATKTTYALFLLYGLFHADALETRHATHAIVFNVKGEDLLYLDKPNVKLTGRRPRASTRRSGLPVGPFASVGLWAPSRAGAVPCPTPAAAPKASRLTTGPCATFCRDRMLRFLFAEADDETSQLSFVVTQVERFLEAEVESQPADRGDVVLHVPGVPEAALRALAAGAGRRSQQLHRRHRTPRCRRHAAGLRPALRGRGPRCRRPHPRDRRSTPAAIASTGRREQVSVIDINRLNDRAKRFVVGVVVRRLMEDKERAGTRDPLGVLSCSTS